MAVELSDLGACPCCGNQDWHPMEGSSAAGYCGPCGLCIHQLPETQLGGSE